MSRCFDIHCYKERVNSEDVKENTSGVISVFKISSLSSKRYFSLSGNMSHLKTR